MFRSRFFVDELLAKSQFYYETELIRDLMSINMVCPNRQCARELHIDWYACPYCGHRSHTAGEPSESECDHEFVVQGPYCIICGFNPEMGGAGERLIHNVFAIGVCVLGGLAVWYGMTTMIQASQVHYAPGEAPISRGGGKGFGVLVVLGFLAFAYGVWHLRFRAR